MLMGALVSVKVRVTLIRWMFGGVMETVVMTGMLMTIVVMVMVVVVAMSGQPPNKKADAGQYEDAPDDVSLLRLKGLPKLKPNGGNDASQHNGREDMPEGGQ